MKTIETTEAEMLFKTYGSYMTYADLAALLKRSPDGLRITLGRDNALSRLLKPTRIKLGRRVYFRTLQVLDALSHTGSDWEDGAGQ